MYLENLTNRGATPALINTLSFAESRHRMLAENVANINTPGYKSKSLDVKGFQRALRAALDEKGGDADKPFVLPSHDQFRTSRFGGLTVTPTTEVAGNLLHHDGTNGSIDQLMADLADNAMVYQAANEILKGYFGGMRKAIRGTL